MRGDWYWEKGGNKGRRRVRASRGANLTIWQQGVMASRSFIFRAFARPEVHGVACQVRLFEGAHCT